MEDAEKGSQQHPDSVPEVGEDAVTSVSPASPPPPMTEEEQQELQEELVKVEDEIQTLTQVLAAKEKQLADIKRKLGITPLNELKQNFTKTWQEVTTSNAYRRTSETLSQAGLKASAAFTNVGTAITRKLEDVSMRSLQHSASMPVMRNAPTFKSFEEKVETLKVSDSASPLFITKMTPAASTTDPGDQDRGSPTSETLLSPPEGSPTQDTPMN
ncbi:tumor protein D52 isoform X1 [Centropristis striata]|uniref:tumor protein D52 isoform X1 n=1 Tax=Centropristis striata TaxID=184440 RepID=UPI0027E205C4|nr:tumor protein D52 isoform X1 [Centropristis striata]